MHPLRRHSWSARNIFGIHRRAPRGAGIVERKRVPGEGDLRGGNSRVGKSFDHVALNPPRSSCPGQKRRSPQGCDENGAAAALLLSRVSITICSLLAAHFDRKLDRGLDLFQQWPGFLQTFSIGMWAFGAVLQQLAGFGVDTDFVCHAAILDIEGVA